MKILRCILLFTVHCSLFTVNAQPFTHADSLRGSNNANRSWWDVLKYDIDVTPYFENKSIKGVVNISIKKIKNGTNKMQIDLQQPLIIDSMFFYKKSKSFQKIIFERSQNIALFQVPVVLNFSIKIYYHGTPREAIKPPWDGGLIWKKDSLNRPWMSVACQGLGASVWFPCKDIQSDEPDLGASLTLHVPDSLVAVSNGRLTNQTKANGVASFTWEVSNPINNYDLSFYIGKYVHFGEIYSGEKGQLTCDYWVLDYNLVKAKLQFTQVPKMLQAFEYWFGPYPFYEDGYKLVEAPHLGMEHQSAVAYGNHFANGYLGRDLSKTGEGLKWDFIIVHESGHEWFGNNITSKDIADMWIHEGFTNYSETLFTEYWFGKEAAQKYVVGIRDNIRNNKPIIGKYGVNNEGSGDMYYKAGNMIHLIRTLMNNDEKFRQMLRSMNKIYYHQTVTTQQIENFMIEKSGLKLKPLFNLYLRSTQPPTFTKEDLKGIK